MISQKDHDLLQKTKQVYDTHKIVLHTTWPWVTEIINSGIATQKRLSEAEEHIDKLVTAGNKMKDASTKLVELQQDRIQDLELQVAYLEGRIETLESEAANA